MILGQLYFWPDMPPKKMARSFNDNGQITKRRLLQFHSISSILPSQLVVSTVILLNGNGCAEYCPTVISEVLFHPTSVSFT